ncbi:Sialic acid synthase [Daphnia magna]|uniref:Sialic acid synthase n=1 Tax=Daphnia magna TaxID=35525 RepID=A0A164Q8A5_9CRUS|nr:Sialic acid synthase [Daphnia magna]
MGRSFELINNRWIGDGYPCFIIAEIGQNHQGDIEIAKKLIKMAKDCGADCVKFQKSDLYAKFTKSVLDRQYESPHAWGSTYGEHKQFLEFSKDQYEELMAFASSLNIHFTASAMDDVSVDFLINLRVPFLKIGSGMQDMKTVIRAMEVMNSFNSKVCLLQCTSSYPTPEDEVHLRVMQTYRDHFPQSPVGYSGHELGLTITLAAAALGAHVIERHITLDKSWKGNDHACSLDETELKLLVEGIRTIEKALGSAIKSKQPSEEPCHQKLGKSIVGKQKLEAGIKLCKEHLTVKVGQPVGWPPQDLDLLIGKTLSRDVDEDETITLDCII